MKVYETASFSFAFCNIRDKKNSFIKLNKLIDTYKWINEIEDYGLCPSFHTDDSGIAYVVFKDDNLSETLIRLADNFFEALVSNYSIEWVKVEYSMATEKIVINNVDKYCGEQSFSVAEMKYGDKVVVYRVKN